MLGLLRLLLGLTLIGLIVTGVVYFGMSGAGPIPPPSRDLTKIEPTEKQELVALGEYVAKAGDCAACHESEDGLALAGGTPMETPMGTIYGTNITPHNGFGIAGYTADDLYRVMVYGIAPGGRRLYPAMPYTSYHAISRADVDALYLYLMAQEPVAKPNRQNDLAFPFNLRPLLAFWNVLFRPDPPAESGPGLSGGEALSAEARGDYMVNTLGHCGECHTPRNAAYAKTDAHLSGNVIEEALAPDITAAGLAARGWTAGDLAQFLSTGLSPQGVMTFRMFPVLSHSTKYLPEQDISAIASYLTAGMPEPSGPPANLKAAQENPQGHRLYLGLCAGCHGAHGQGQPAGSVPMVGNTTLMFDNPVNLHRVIQEGIPARHLTGHLRMQEMPPFEHRISSDDLKALSDYLRARWGGR